MQTYNTPRTSNETLEFLKSGRHDRIDEGELLRITDVTTAIGMRHCANKDQKIRALLPSSILLSWEEVLKVPDCEVFTTMPDLPIWKIYSKGGEQVKSLGPHLSVIVIKDEDDWFWVFVDGFTTIHMSESLFRDAFPEHGDEPLPDVIGKDVWTNNLFAIWKCDQLRGLLDCLGSSRMRDLATKYPGSPYRRKDRPS
jgi:hypothetical protein